VDDQQAADEARQLLQYSDRIGWRLAELTWQQLHAGTNRTRWANELGVARQTVNRWWLIWARYGTLPAGKRPRYAEALRVVVGTARRAR
jgi:hypothetical protein